MRELLVIGGGNIFQTGHLPNFVELGITVKAVVEPSAKVVNDLKGILPGNVAYYASLADVDLTTIKYALIASPAGAHYPTIKELSKYPIHILCEKPVAISAEQANELYAIYKDSDKVLQIGFQRRYFPTNSYVKQVIADKTYGNLSHINIWGGWNARGSLPQTILNKQLSGGGILLDYGVHFTDMLLYWADGVDLIEYFDDSHGGIEVNAVSVYNLKLNGQFTKPNAKTYYSWTNQMSNTVQLMFDDALLVLGVNNPTTIELVRINNQITDTRRVLNRETITVGPDDFKGAMVAQWEEFFAKANKTLKTPAVSSLADAVAATNLTEQCYNNRKELTFNWGY